LKYEYFKEISADALYKKLGLI